MKKSQLQEGASEEQSASSPSSSADEEQSQQHDSEMHICCICNDVFHDQLKFFEHLKAHYEGPGESQPQQQPPSPPLQSPLPLLTSVTTPPAPASSSILENTQRRSSVVHHNQPNHRIVTVQSSGFTDLQFTAVCQQQEGDSNDDGQLFIVEDPFASVEEDILNDISAGRICDELCTSTSNLETHLSEARPKVPQKSSALSGSTSTPNMPKKKTKTPPDPKPLNLECSECSRVFQHRATFLYHMKGHSGERPYLCETCGKRFFTSSALASHLLVHSGEKPYKCGQCDKTFRQWGDLNYHSISIHSDIRQHQCEFCGKSFARRYSLIVHRRIHTGERNYKCEFCDKGFRSASHLQTHRMIHTGEKPYACPVCDKSFRVQTDMRRHAAIHNKRKKPDRPGSADSDSAPVAEATTTSSSGQEDTQILVNNGHSSVVNVSNCNTTSDELFAVLGPSISQLAQRSQNQTLDVLMTASGINVHVGHQEFTINDATGEVISENIRDGIPITITLIDETPSSEVSVVAVQESYLLDGVMYQNRDGQVEVVTIRDSTTGAVYVCPVLMDTTKLH